MSSRMSSDALGCRPLLLAISMGFVCLGGSEARADDTYTVGDRVPVLELEDQTIREEIGKARTMSSILAPPNVRRPSIRSFTRNCACKGFARPLSIWKSLK